MDPVVSEEKMFENVDNIHTLLRTTEAYRYYKLTNPFFTATLLENNFLRTEDFSEKQFYWFQNMLI